MLTGPSGVGKTTVANGLLAVEKNVARVVTYTTREKREGEVDGRDYHFVSREEFERKIAQGEMLEWAGVYGHLYGQTVRDVENILDEGRDVLLVLDPQGVKTIRQSGREATAIFLDAPDQEILSRLIRRDTDTEDVIERRQRDLAFDRTHAAFCTHVVQNTEGQLVKTIEAIRKIMYTVRT